MPRERRWILHLAIAAAAGALIWVGDIATGRHLASAMSRFAVKLAVWYEDRRTPTVLCQPHKAVPYTQLAGVEFDVPECWRAESTALLDREVHRFFDPDARAGIVSISMDRLEGDEDRRALESEFDALAERATSRVDDPGAEGGDLRIHSAADSLAERFSAEKEPAPGGGAAGAAGSANPEAGAGRTASAPAGTTAPATGSAGAFKSVESIGMLGRVDESSPEETAERFGVRPSSGGGPQRAWSWLLLSDHQAVRVVYSVRDEWVGEPAVTGELKRVRALVASIRPAQGDRKIVDGGRAP